MTTNHPPIKLPAATHTPGRGERGILRSDPGAGSPVYEHPEDPAVTRRHAATSRRQITSTHPNGGRLPLGCLE